MSLTKHSTTLGGWLKIATIELSNISSTPALDAELLAAHTYNNDRSWVLAHLDQTINNSEISIINGLLNQRKKHVPLAYITGSKEFYGRMFKVNKSTLIPRPESEDIVVLFTKVISKSKVDVVIDLGTGSGCLAITAYIEYENFNTRNKVKAEYIAIDTSRDALEVAKSNAKQYGAGITFLEGNLLQPVISNQNLGIESKNICILANLPYVPNKYKINEDAKHEPGIALFGGDDGLDLYKEMFVQLTDCAGKVDIITESLELQHSQLAEIAASYGFILVETLGLAQHFRR